MNVNLARDMISKVYPGERWLKRVQLMKPNQVMAIYYSFLRAGKFDISNKKEPTGPIEVQMTIWDLYSERRKNNEH